MSHEKSALKEFAEFNALCPDLKTYSQDTEVKAQILVEISQAFLESFIEAFGPSRPGYEIPRHPSESNKQVFLSPTIARLESILANHRRAVRKQVDRRWGLGSPGVHEDLPHMADSLRDLAVEIKRSVAQLLPQACADLSELLCVLKPRALHLIETLQGEPGLAQLYAQRITTPSVFAQVYSVQSEAWLIQTALDFLQLGRNLTKDPIGELSEPKIKGVLAR